MGQEISKEEGESDDLADLTALQLGGIGHEFNQLYLESGGKHGKLLDRGAFSRHFKLPGILGDRLFEAFDTKKDGAISFEEFGRGLTIIVDGSTSEKCELLFRMFNLAGDDGVSRDELYLMVHATLQSAYTILRTCSPAGSAIMSGEGLHESVQRIVNEAFEKCDLSNTGKLSPQEFDLWMRRNRSLLDSIVSWRTRQLPKRQGTANHPTLEAVDEPAVSTAVETDAQETSPLIQTTPPDSQLTSSVQATPDSHLTLDMDLDEVRLTPSSTPATSRRETPAARESPSITNQTLSRQANEEPAVDTGTEGSIAEGKEVTSTQRDEAESVRREPSLGEDSSSSIGGLSSLPNTPALIEDVDDPETDGTKSRTSSLPVAVFHSGEAHLVEEERKVDDEGPEVPLGFALAPVQSPTLLGSPIYETEAGLSADTLPAVIFERHRTAWIASTQTKQLLATMATGTQLTRIEPMYLTMPYLVVDEAKVDPVRDLLSRFGLESEARERHVLTVDSVTMDNVGLQKLLGSGCYRAALELTGRFLTAHGQGLGQRGQPALHTHKTLQMWLARIALFMKLHMFAAAQSELEAFGNMDAPDLYFDYYPDTYPGRTGCMVPFSLRLLHAVLPQYVGHPLDGLDRLEHLHHLIKKILSNLEHGLAEDGSKIALAEDDVKGSFALWNKRLLDVDYAIANCCLSLKDYSVAVGVFESIASRDGGRAPVLISLIGRIYLQLGDLTSAHQAFEKAETLLSDKQQLPVMHAMHEAFLSVATGAYQEAYSYFQTVFTHEPGNAVVVNNMAVCLLYMGQLGKAVQVLEELVWRDPPSHLQPATICNLCTLYELQSSRATDKKLNVLRLVSRHCGDGFLADCLKLAL